MSGPVTEAGRRLLERFRLDYDRDQIGDLPGAILAIEAEARAAAVAPLEKALRAIKEGIEATAGDDPEGPVPSGIWYDIACAALSAPSPVREPERTPATWLIDQDFDE